MKGDLIQGFGGRTVKFDDAEWSRRSRWPPGSRTGVGQDQFRTTACVLDTQAIGDVGSRTRLVGPVGWTEREIRQDEGAFPDRQRHGDQRPPSKIPNVSARLA